MRSTLYDVLGISDKASANEISAAYRLKEEDLNNASDPEAQSQLKLVHEAYAILSDPDRRSKYDQGLKVEAAKSNNIIYYENARGGSGFLVKLLLLIALAAGGYFLYTHYAHGNAAAHAASKGDAASGAPIDAPATVLGTEEQAFAGVERRAKDAPVPDINDIEAVPLSAPGAQRPLYQSFLAHSPPRAFIICNDGSARSVAGSQAYVDRQLASRGAGCVPYAVNDSVVWRGRSAVN